MNSLCPRAQSNDGRTIILFQVSFYASNLLGGHGDVENDCFWSIVVNDSAIFRVYLDTAYFVKN